MKLHKTKENEVYYYFLKNGEKRFMYRHKYYDSLGKRKEVKKSGFKTDKEALRTLLGVKVQVLNDGSSLVENSQLTVTQLLDVWLDIQKHKWKASTYKNNKIIVEKHIKSDIGHLKINSMTAGTYEREYINKKLDDGYKPNSVHRYHTLFKTAVNFAVQEEIVSRNKFTNIQIKRDNQLKNFLSPSELNIFLQYVKEHGNITQYTLVMLLAFTGIRKGEALGLKWSSLDFNENTITIDATRDYNGIRSPKTKGSYRKIEVDKSIIKLLSNYLIWCKKQKFSYGIKHKVSDIIFITNDTTLVWDSYVNVFFKEIYKHLKNDEVKINKITPHGLRHTHATILIDKLIPPTDIADRLGNSLDMIYNVYAHSFKKADNKLVEAFSTSVFGAKTGAK